MADQEFLIVSHDCNSICKAVGQMGRELRTRARADGVETVAQVKAAEALGCSQAQGSLMADPMPVGEFEARWLLPRTKARQPGESVPA